MKRKEKNVLFATDILHQLFAMRATGTSRATAVLFWYKELVAVELTFGTDSQLERNQFHRFTHGTL